jgi:hypothetical protein
MACACRNLNSAMTRYSATPHHRPAEHQPHMAFAMHLLLPATRSECNPRLVRTTTGLPYHSNSHIEDSRPMSLR